ncbi:MAG: VCBS domain-containing protein [Gallionella sp.]
MTPIYFERNFKQARVMQYFSRPALRGARIIIAALFLCAAGVVMAEDTPPSPLPDNPPEISSDTSANEAATSTANVAAVLGAADVVLTETNAVLRTKGTLSISDVDSPATFVVQHNTKGKYGTFNIDPAGAWTYVANSVFDELNVGQSLIDVFPVASADGTSTSVRITINGSNDEAVLGRGSVVLTETDSELKTGGTLSITDLDNPPKFVAKKNVAGRYGTFSINASGGWTYVTNGPLNDLRQDQSVSDNFTVNSEDGTETTVQVTIKGTNDPAVLRDANVTLTETDVPLRTSGRLSIRDVDSPETFVVQNNVAGTYGNFSVDAAGRWTYVTNSALDYLNVGKSVTDSFAVTSSDGTATTVNVTINGTNDAAIVGTAHVSLTETDVPLSASGQLNVSDVDNPPTFTAQSDVAGTYGIFNIDSNGAWTYQANSAFDELNVGKSLTDSFAVTSVDGTPSKVTITINGSNDAAILSPVSMVLDETNTPLNTGGTLTITDVDNPPTFVAQKEVGQYGTFKINKAGTWSYVTHSALNELNVGQSAIDRFTISSVDGTQTTVQITINGTNDPALLSSAETLLTETDVPLRSQGKLSVSDVDSPQIFVAQSKVKGTYGVFNLESSGAWSYVTNNALDELNQGQRVSDLFNVTSADGTPTTVTITILGTNDSPILRAADVVLTETNEPLSTAGKLIIRKGDNPETFVAQQNVAGTNGIFNIDSSGAWTYVTNSALDELNAGQSAIDIFPVTSTDGATTTVKVTVNGTNAPAILSAADIVLDETNVPLQPSGKLTVSDRDNAEMFVAQHDVAGIHGVFNIDSTGAWHYVANSALDELNVGQSVSDTFPVFSVDGTSTSVKVTIHGTNDPAILSADDITLDETNAPLTFSGTLTVSDVDNPQTFVAQSMVAGNNGVFNIEATGAWTYVANSAFDELNIGNQLSDHFIVSSADGTTTTVKVTINGTNDPAVLSAANINLDEIKVPQSAAGQLTIRDVDNPEAFVAQKDVMGTTGTFNVDTSGAWTYLANSNFEKMGKGDVVSSTFTVSSTDGTNTTVKVTIHGKGPSEFRGKYFGIKFGINNSTASGTTSAPSASTLAYGLQGGYLQGGYNWDLRTLIVGVGAYFDWNSYIIHSNGVGYGSHAYGVDAKLGPALEDWLPYIKVGYGYSSGGENKILSKVAQKGFNLAIGVEYNLAPRWSVIGEYKRNRFSNRDHSITINNKTFTFGINYYFDIPLIRKKVELAPEDDIPLPEAILAPDALPEAPPAP